MELVVNALKASNKRALVLLPQCYTMRHVPNSIRKPGKHTGRASSVLTAQDEVCRCMYLIYYDANEFYRLIRCLEFVTIYIRIPALLTSPAASFALIHNYTTATPLLLCAAGVHQAAGGRWPAIRNTQRRQRRLVLDARCCSTAASCCAIKKQR